MTQFFMCWRGFKEVNMRTLLKILTDGKGEILYRITKIFSEGEDAFWKATMTQAEDAQLESWLNEIYVD